MDYQDDESLEESWETRCDVEPDEGFEPDLFFFDCESPEWWFDIEDDEWFESQTAEAWHWDDDIWYNCRRCPKLLETKAPVKPKPKRRKVKKVVPSQDAFPCVLMLVSYLMLTMYTVGSMFMGAAAQWKQYWMHMFDSIKVPQALYRRLKLFLWPPPEQKKQVERHKAHRKKLLLTALAIAALKADGAAPKIHLSKHRSLRRHVRKATNKHGTLLSSKLSTEGVKQVRNALQALPADLFQQGDSQFLIIDSGASDTASGDKNDAVPGTIEALPTPRKMDGIGGTLEATHKCTFRYEVLADDSSIQVIETQGYYVPGLSLKLLSPQDYSLQMYAKGLDGYKFSIDWRGSSLELGPTATVTLPHDQATKLPKLRCYHNAMETAESLLTTCVTDEYNQNLTQLQKALLQWHWKLGHVGFQRLQWIGRQGWLGKIGERFGVSSTQPPKCAACQFGKQERNPKAGSTIKPDQTREGVLKAEQLKPGELIFSDQYVSSLPGRVFGRRGAAITTQKYCGGTLFYDAATGKMKVVHQVSLGAQETVQSKLEFEREAHQLGITVKNYQTDNGVYTSQEFLKELIESGQGLKHSGVGGHHHNGPAENAIKNVIRTSTTMMIHAALRWPDQSQKELWPLALDHAIYLHNHTPSQASGRCPEELWTSTSSSYSALTHARVWGCPAYVLDPRLQDGKKIPKWQPKSRRGQYVGASQLHASSVGLIRNLRTDNLSPQFHVVYDNYFETVHSTESEIPAGWENLVTYSRDRVPMDDDDPENLPELADEWLSEPEMDIRRRQRMERRDSQVKPPQPPDSSDPPAEPTEPSQPEPLPQQQPVPVNPQTPSQAPVTVDPTEAQEPTSVTRRSRRQRYARAQYVPGTAGIEKARALVFVIARKAAWSAMGKRDYSLVYTLLLDHQYGVVETMLPFVQDQMSHMLKASSTDPDTPNFAEAMRGEHRESFIEAMGNEIQELEKHGTWDLVKRTSVPEGANILPGTWVFRIKRYPDGRFRKTKARFCVRGDKQVEGVDYFETYAPVVSWSTVRLLLCLSLSQGWKTRQVDFANAFVQAEIKEDVYVTLPAAFTGPNGESRDEVVMKLKRSLYGTKQAPMYWFNFLKNTLESKQIGFTQSELDPCLFTGDGIVVLVYVDDCLFFGPDLKKIDAKIQALKDMKLSLTVETEDAYAFLGVDIKKNAKGGFTMTQEGLIKKVISYCGMKDCNRKKTPAGPMPLGSDENGAKFDEKWNYASAVGMLLYLSSNSRPDIQFAVHQCARFTHNPRKSHAEAIKRICRYLEGTKDKGLEFTPTTKLELDCYVDADFAGLWNYEPDQDPVCVKSRTGYCITLGSCPVVWVSKLQTEIACSTLEAEYIALSTAMRDLLPMRRILAELGTRLKLEFMQPAMIHSTIFEDNNGALGLATAPKLTPRTKHIAVKYHWFKSHIGEDKGFVIQKIESKEQKADIFTKGLTTDTFEHVRELLMGW